ncbi:MAG: universal stress protein [Candidatus Obscuribacterales bacterium]|jgi:nucleotide-binding universal stress UspA family protein|nr:universal stress protein [Candidatus Obscuribacterales bacterium]
MKVLVAVEDQKYGLAVIDFISKHQWSEDTEFKIIHVIEPLLIGSYMSVYPSALLQEINEQSTKYATSLMADMKKNLQKAVPHHHVFTDVFTEIPKYGIINAAKEWPADLIIMGSHGRRGFNKLLLGSVAEAVMSAANCSVTVVRIPETDQNSTAKSHQEQKKEAAAK